jgi:phage repressor protein C with HTH and peptisase S24 domain
MARVAEAEGIPDEKGKYARLAEVLRISASNISRYKQSGNIPWTHILNWASRRGVNYKWVIDGPGAGPARTGTESAEKIKGDIKLLPVFDAGAGEPRSWTDGGYPVGEASSKEFGPPNCHDPNAFYVRIHGDSMYPTLEDGDLALVEPGQPLQNKRLCFVSFPGDDGDRLVKRFRALPHGEVVLESDNRRYEDILINEHNGQGVRIYRVTRIVRDDRPTVRPYPREDISSDVPRVTSGLHIAAEPGDEYPTKPETDRRR